MKEDLEAADNPYSSIPAVITDIQDESPNIKTFELEPEEPLKFSTGEFVQLSVPGLGEAPFTPSSSPNVEEKLEITIMEAGEVTGVLHETPPGETLGIRGPYGRGYPLEEMKERDILVVGGGVGLAPLRSLLYMLMDKPEDFGKMSLKYGARTPEHLIYKDQLDKWDDSSVLDLELTVDEGDEDWEGNVGVVTTLLEEPDVDTEEGLAVVCGPPVMMKFTAQKLMDFFDPEDVYLSLEKNMSCGFGMCGHCQLGKYYVCKDGPVFTYDQVKDIPDLWE
ncbi:FAD/NAD(P)-binding protein [Candidatus Bipolaricaulota bacterium]|nr:FAD/NAD(P)-binding protein [Candidatus Bipolaricaulota bacterium]